MTARTNLSNGRLLLSCCLLHRGWSTWKCMTSNCTQTLKIWSCRRTVKVLFIIIVWKTLLSGCINILTVTPITELVYLSYILDLEFKFFYLVYRFFYSPKVFSVEIKWNWTWMELLTDLVKKIICCVLTFINENESSILTEVSLIGRWRPYWTVCYSFL